MKNFKLMNKQEIIAFTKKIEAKFDAMNLRSGDRLTREQKLDCSKYYEILTEMANQLLSSKVISNDEGRDLLDNFYWPVIIKINKFVDEKVNIKGQNLVNKLIYLISLRKIVLIESEFNKIKNLPEVVDSYESIDIEIRIKCSKLFYKLNDLAERIEQTGVYGTNKERKYINGLALRIFKYVDEECSNHMFADSFRDCHAFHFNYDEEFEKEC